MHEIMEPFWMVWDGSYTPSRHPNRSSADMEAQRLALKHPGSEFFVLKSMGSFTAIKDPFVVKVVK